MTARKKAPDLGDVSGLWAVFETERKAYLRAIEGDECSLDERVKLAQAMHRAHDAFYAAVTGEKPTEQRMCDALDTIEFARSALLMIDEAGAFAGHPSPTATAGTVLLHAAQDRLAQFLKAEAGE